MNKLDRKRKVKKSPPLGVVNDFLQDKISKSGYMEIIMSLGRTKRYAFDTAEKLERKFKWKGITTLRRKDDKIEGSSTTDTAPTI